MTRLLSVILIALILTLAVLTLEDKINAVSVRVESLAGVVQGLERDINEK